MEHRLRLIALALAALWLGSGTALGQQPEPSLTATPAAAIPLAEIPTEADQTLAELRRIDAAAAPAAEILAVAGAISRREPRIREELAEAIGTDADSITTRRVEDRQIVWAQHAERIEGWTVRLEERWKVLQQRREQLSRRREQWEETRRATRGDVPAEVAQRIDAVLDAIAGAEERLRDRADAVARLTEKVAELRSLADSARDRLDVLERRVRERLLVRDARPIWEPGSQEASELAEQARRARRYWLETLQGWATARQGLLLALLGLLVVALASALALRRRSRSWSGALSLSPARAVVEWPIASATAFTLMGLVLLEPRLPSAVLDVVFVLALYPVLALGGVLVSPGLRRVLYAAAALGLVERASALGPDGSLLRRLLVLAVAALAAFGALLLLRRWRAAGAPTGWRQAVLVALRGAAALLVLSTLANLLGWLTLAETLSSATLATGFAAIAWLVAARASQSLVPLIPGGALGRWLPSVRRHALGMERVCDLAIAVVAVALWAEGALRRFQLWEPLVNGVRTLLGATLAVGGLEVSSGRLLAALLVLALVVPLSRSVRFLLREEVLPRVSLPAGADNTVLTLAHYSLLAGAVVLAAIAAGLGATEVTVVFGALGVGIGFGLQNIVNNFVSGLILIFERPIKVGDRVETAQHLGIVSRIGTRASTVRTFDGAEVVIPNGDLISKELINWTLSDQVRRIDLRVGVAYGSEPRRVLELLQACATSHERVLAEPPPNALMIGFGDSSLDFRLLAWVGVEEFLQVSSELHVAVVEALDEAGISIPFPQRDVHVRTFSAPVPPGEADAAQEPGK